MTMIKKLIGAVALMLTCTTSFAAEASFPLDTAPDRVADMASLQNGAKLFVNYCLNCHSANSMRYNKLTEIGLTDDQIKNNLLFSSDKVGDLMTIAMQAKDAKAWFGTAPPDLSLMARAKSGPGHTGADYIYTYLRSFYRDTSTKTGWDNVVYPKVAMPHVLWQLQGPRQLTKTELHREEGKNGAEGPWERVVTTYDDQGYSTVKKESAGDYHGNGDMEAKFISANIAQSNVYDNNVADLTAFLSWMAEPIQQFRRELGVWVLLFLGLFFVVAWRLNASYWKHVR
jgi:ubiquinol-cytochrome c reductase cytochrome c1 subunit